MADNAKWYVLHTYSGYENAVKAAIEKSVANRGLEDMVQKMEIPMETVTEVTEAGVMKEVERKVFPGYVLIKMVLDLVYIGNWILNSTREKDRFEDYDILQEKLFAQCAKNGMNALISRWQGHIFPSPAYENGGIHEAIADYEDAVFFDILAEELARRDLGCLDSEPADYTELNARMDEYMDEFEKSGVENLVLEA